MDGVKAPVAGGGAVSETPKSEDSQPITEAAGFDVLDGEFEGLDTESAPSLQKQLIESHLKPLDEKLAKAWFRKQELVDQIAKTQAAIPRVADQIERAEHIGRDVTPEESGALMDIARSNPEASGKISEFLSGIYKLDTAQANDFSIFKAELQGLVVPAEPLNQCKGLFQAVDVSRRAEALASQIQFSGVHLSAEDGNLLRLVAEKKPEFFNSLQEFVFNQGDSMEQFGNLIVGAAELFDLDRQNVNNPYPRNMQGLLNEIQSTRSLTNTQAITDFLEAGPAERLKTEKTHWQSLLDGSWNQERAEEAGFVTDPQVLADQNRAIGAATQFARQHGFGETQWFPGGRQGKGVLFHVAWDEAPQTLQMGVMLGNRVRLTRLPITGDAAQACEEKIHKLHTSLISGQEPDKLVM
ncbi:MAG: hypothetical protein JKY15_08025 [Deltaproteobacteria bacterium]|nr:hypothetical protein [Deltaproteobacteria bacterium]